MKTTINIYTLADLGLPQKNEGFSISVPSNVSVDRVKRFAAIIGAIQDEDELHKFISEDEQFSNPDNWKVFNNDYKNSRVINSQATTGKRALIEIINNATEAILMKDVMKKGVDIFKKNKGYESYYEAFASAYGFDLTKPLTDKAESRKMYTALKKHFKKRMVMILNGDKKSPTIDIIDDGCGVPSNKFERSFCTLSNSIKEFIHFVQGIFGVGRTAMQKFLGKYRYSVIASIPCDEWEEASNLTFTIIRQHQYTEEETADLKYTDGYYEYLTPVTLPVAEIKFPHYPERNTPHVFTSGTIVRAFNYSDIIPEEKVITNWQDIQWRFHLHYGVDMHNTGIPLTIFENRMKPIENWMKNLKNVDVSTTKKKLAYMKSKVETVYCPSWNISAAKKDRAIVHNAQHVVNDTETKSSYRVNVSLINPKTSGGGSFGGFLKTTDKHTRFTLNGTSNAEMTTLELFTNETQRKKCRERLGAIYKDFLFIHIECCGMNKLNIPEVFRVDRSIPNNNKTLRRMKEVCCEVILNDQELIELNKAELRRSQQEAVKGASMKVDSTQIYRDEINKVTKKINRFKSVNNPVKTPSKSEPDTDNPNHNPDTTPPPAPEPEPKKPLFDYPSILNADVKIDKATGRKCKEVSAEGFSCFTVETDAKDEFFASHSFQDGEPLEFMFSRQPVAINSDSTSETPREDGNTSSDPQVIYKCSKPSDGNIRVRMKLETKEEIGTEFKVKMVVGKGKHQLKEDFWIKTIKKPSYTSIPSDYFKSPVDKPKKNWPKNWSECTIGDIYYDKDMCLPEINVDNTFLKSFVSSFSADLVPFTGTAFMQFMSKFFINHILYEWVDQEEHDIDGKIDKDDPQSRMDLMKPHVDKFDSYARTYFNFNRRGVFEVARQLYKDKYGHYPKDKFRD